MAVEMKAREITEWLPEFSPVVDLVKRATPEKAARAEAEEGYYGVPLLKRPSWRWEIALYFFFEGISSGSFILSSLADMFGRERYRDLVQAGYYTSFLSLLPCPPLLIADLGRPERFHHMLRIFKPSSPMNLGAWALTAFSLPNSFLTVRQLTGDGPSKNESRLAPAPLAGAMGLPFAITMASYPGVLLSTTSTPIWSKSRFLGALMACSSISTGAAAVSLALAISSETSSDPLETLEKIGQVSRLCEGAALAAYLVTTGDAARPLVKGKYSPQFWLGAVGAGLVLPTILEGKSSSKRKKSLASTILSSALTLAGGLALKWAVTYAGRESAEDIEATRTSFKRL